MKNQYFGDIYDYLKYSLLRRLAGQGKIPTAICWMLTEDDGRPDGRRIDYLNEPERWRKFDPAVFKYLQRQVLEHKARNVQGIQDSGLLPNARFYSDLLTDGPIERREYFDGFLGFARGSTLAFFDPDNGIEIKSVKHGKRHSSKYLYWTEIERSLSAGHSLLIYQHFPPRPRHQFVHSLASKFLRLTELSVVYSIRTRRVAFLFVPQETDRPFFLKTLAGVKTAWNGVFHVEEHRYGKDD